MKKEEVIEEFERHAVLTAGFLEEYYDAEKIAELKAVAMGTKKVSKDERDKIKRNLDILKYEMLDLKIALKRFNRLF